MNFHGFPFADSINSFFTRSSLAVSSISRPINKRKKSYKIKIIDYTKKKSWNRRKEKLWKSFARLFKIKFLSLLVRISCAKRSADMVGNNWDISQMRAQRGLMFHVDLFSAETKFKSRNFSQKFSTKSFARCERFNSQRRWYHNEKFFTWKQIFNWLTKRGNEAMSQLTWILKMSLASSWNGNFLLVLRLETSCKLYSRNSPMPF